MYPFLAEYDEYGVWVYQAFKPSIAEPALTTQTFHDTEFDPHRMTWIKPSFAWMLYRSGYGTKHNQERVLKIKVNHQTMAKLLKVCKCKEGGGGSLGRVQWDPARDLYSPEPKRKREPRKKLTEKAIQIGLKGKLNQLYTDGIIEIQDVTELAHAVKKVHQSEECDMSALNLPKERPYVPQCDSYTLEKLKIKT